VAAGAEELPGAVLGEVVQARNSLDDPGKGFQTATFQSTKWLDFVRAGYPSPWGRLSILYPFAEMVRFFIGIKLKTFIFILRY